MSGGKNRAVLQKKLLKKNLYVEQKIQERYITNSLYDENTAPDLWKTSCTVLTSSVYETSKSKSWK